ncbi:MAG: DUF1993 family protein [Bradymonadia bacterium]
MSVSIYDLTVPFFISGLSTLKGVLQKAESYATEGNIEPGVLLNARLFPDMFPLVRQVWACTDTARRGTQRVAGLEPSSVEDNETSFEELYARIDSTIATLKEIDVALFEEAETRAFTMNLGQEMHFTGRSFVLGFAQPNFLFHVATAYNILRHNGVQIGKRDFIAPFMMAQM